MERNFFRRVEVSYPLVAAPLKARVIADLDLALSDNCQAWELQSDATYRLLRPEPGKDSVSSHGQLLERLADSLSGEALSIRSGAGQSGDSPPH